MSFMRSSRLRLSLLLLGACVSSVDASAGSAAAQTTGLFNGIHFKNTNGRVGYHMFAQIQVPQSGLPTATCSPAANKTTTRGVLPPGLVLLANDQPNEGGLHGFDGTPRQPGDWTVFVDIGHVSCSGDPTDYGPRTVEVDFHIDP